MIVSFRCKETEKIFRGKYSTLFPPDIQKTARRKLDLLQAATTLEFLRSPGNRLEALKGNLKGQHSIRINDKWRICFVWAATGVQEVAIVDYH